MENLDAMCRSDLMAFWSRFNKPRPYESGKLFGFCSKASLEATQSCANYALNKAEAIRCRKGGDIISAQLYELICQRIYNRLPGYARW